MGFKSFLVKPFAKKIAKDIDKWSVNAVAYQDKIFKDLISIAQHTAFGKDHDFKNIKSYEDFKERVRIKDYEGLRPYIERIKKGEADVLWKGIPKYFAKTSGTTSGVKYIPITKESIPNHFGTARNAMFNYYAKTGQGKWLDGKLIFLSGSPELQDINGILTGRLSGISNHMIPAWLKTSQMPSYETNCIDDWETKVDKIVEETLREDMRMISGTPPWVQMYYERLIAVSGKKHIKDIFPNFEVFVFGGVNYEPYRQVLEGLIGKRIPSVETYPSSEGFIAFQDSQTERGLLLNVNSGIFFEFIPADEIFSETPTRVSLKNVELGVNYAIILNNNAGLWGYNIGDTVEFVSKYPPRLVVTGRTKHFISAFGEHVIGKEVEEAMLKISREMSINITEFTVAPQVVPPTNELPYHEWLIEFNELPSNLEEFRKRLDAEMVRQNTYYEDLIVGKILQPLKITPMRRNAFIEYMKSQGKLGGQNKVPRLSNDRKIADAISVFTLK